MPRRTINITLFTIGLCVLNACSEKSGTPLSPTSVTPANTFATGDERSLKVDAPLDLSPNNTVVGTSTPTLMFTNPASHFVRIGLAYDIDVQHENGDTAYARTIGESPTTSAHTLDADLARGQTFWWRARARLGDEVGPWSDFAVFHVSGDASGGGGGLAPPSRGPLPFPVPGDCGPFGPGDRSACVAAMLDLSPWWPACRAGSGTNCHRFTRSVAAALATHDGNWGLISKNPGEQQCHWDGCGPGDGSGYGEDIVAYHTGGGDWIGWDIVSGAGAPGAAAQWSPVGGRRAGNDWRPVPPFP